MDTSSILFTEDHETRAKSETIYEWVQKITV